MKKGRKTLFDKVKTNERTTRKLKRDLEDAKIPKLLKKAYEKKIKDLEALNQRYMMSKSYEKVKRNRMLQAKELAKHGGIVGGIAMGGMVGRDAIMSLKPDVFGKFASQMLEEDKDTFELMVDYFVAEMTAGLIDTGIQQNSGSVLKDRFMMITGISLDDLTYDEIEDIFGEADKKFRGK